MRTLAMIAILACSAAVQAADCVVVVLDTSGSMGDYMRTVGKSRGEVAQEALISVLSKVPSSTKIGILTFDGWIYDIQHVDRAKLQQAILNLRMRGGTPLYEYISEGATQLLKERSNNGNIGSYKLLVVTDGEAADPSLNDPSEFSDGSAKPGVLDDVMRRGIVVDAIGLDMDEDHSLKTMINGSYMRGDDRASLEHAVSKAVAEVGFGDAQDVASDFAELDGLPDEFARATITGLTSFANHPIGEKPPVMVGTVTIEAPQPEPEGSSVWLIVMVAFGVLAMVIFLVVLSRGV